MPIPGGGVTKADGYYAVMRDFNNREWLQFARSSLGIASSDLDDIKHNYHNDIREQKYQTILKWEQKLGFAANPNVLRQLANQYLGRPTRPTPSEAPSAAAPSVHEVPANTTLQMSQSDLQYRAFLLTLSKKLSEQDFEALKAIFSNVTYERHFTSAVDLVFYLDNTKLWGSGDRLTVLQNVMAMIGRGDLGAEVNQFRQRPFVDQDDIDAQPFGGQSTSESPSMIRGSSQHTERPSTHSTQGNNNVSGSAIQEVIQQIGFRTQQAPGNQTTVAPQIHVQTLNVTVSSGPGIQMFGEMPDVIQKMDTEDSHSVEPDVENMCDYPQNFEVAKASKDSFEKHKENHLVYPINNNKLKGHVLILSNTNFSRCWGSQYNRGGGKQDCTLMKRLFEELGFNVDVYQDNTAEQMHEIVVGFSQASFHKKANSCIVIVMSHGSFEGGRDVFYGTDGRPVFAEDVVREFDNDSCQNLRGKPKIFLFQFCRGKVADKGVVYDKPDVSPTESLNRLLPDHDVTDGPGNTAMDHTPTRSDVLIAFATQQGQLSFRSWFTNAIFNVFSKKAHKNHVCDMLKEVKRGLAARVSNTPANQATDQCKEMADVRDILLKNLYFFPGFPEK